MPSLPDTWISSLPPGWVVRRAKYLFDRVDVRSSTGSEPLLTVSSREGVVLRSDHEVMMFKAESYAGHKLCWPGDLVINSLWAWARGLGFSRHHGIVSTAYGVYRPKPKYADYSTYWNLLLRSSIYQWQFQVRSKGIWKSRLQLTDDAFLDMPVLVPPPEARDQILAALTPVLEELADAIATKKRLVRLLEEERQSLVAEAVLGAVTSEPDLAPSSLVWVDKLPQSWDLQRMKVVLAERSQKGFPALPLLAATQSKGVVRKEDYENRTVVAQKDLHLLKLVEVGDFVISLRSFQGGIERAHHRGIISPAYTVLYPRKSSNADYLAYLFKSRPFLELLRLNVTGIREGQNIDYTRLSRELIPVPPPNEQDAIVRYLDAEAKRIDKSITNAQRQIELLEEYRTVLIADSVTGKLDLTAADSRTPGTVAEKAVEAAAAGETP